MDRGAWKITVHMVAKESDVTVTKQQEQYIKITSTRESPGRQLVRTLCFRCRGHGFNP